MLDLISIPRRSAVLIGLLIVCAFLWLGLLPWRPNLAGDDFGYYESVIATIAEGRVMLSDWLNPFSVGLTIPAAVFTSATGDIWLGCMLTVGLFGLVGGAALFTLLGELGVSRSAAATATFGWMFLPIWLSKWTHFESSVPATSLMITALWCLVRGSRPQISCLRADWPWLLGGAVATAWAISIRQNHVILIGAGAMVSWTTHLDRRGTRVVLWCLVPLMVFALLQFRLPKTYAMEHMLDWRLSQLTLESYLANFLRGLAFSAGAAFVMMALSIPATTKDWFRRRHGASVWVGGLTVLTILVSAAVVGKAGWIAPATDILLLQRLWPVSVGVVLIGAWLWPEFAFSNSRGNFINRSTILILAAIGYLLLTAVWGYWEYYYLETTLLLWCSVLTKERPSVVHSALRFPLVISRLLVLGVLGGSWFGQRLALDEQSQRLQIFEQAFRQGIATPAESSGMHFGLSGWNLFQSYAERWGKSRVGNPLGFWENRPTEVYFRWEPVESGRLAPEDVPLLQGQATVGFRPVAWTLFRRAVARPNSVADMSAPAHRPVPLSRAEWDGYLRHNSRK